MADSKQNKPYQDILDQILADFAKLGAFGGKPDTSAPNVTQEVDFTNSSGNSNQDAWQNTLNSILQSGNMDISGITSMLEGYLNHSRTQSTERSDMFYQYLLSLLTTSEQRGYDWKMLQESRIYNNPTNELARLMGAGLSRDAALQLLSGGTGSGSGNSSPLIGSGFGATAPSPTGTSGDQNVAIANTVLNGVQTFSSLVGLGFSIPQALSQIKILDAQAVMTEQQKNSYFAASGAYNVLSNCGEDIDPNVYGSISGISKKIRELAEGGNAVAADYVSSGQLDTLVKTAPYSGPFLNQMYRNEVDSSNYATEFGKRMRNLDADSDLKMANKFQIEEQVKLIEPQIENLRQSTEYMKAQANLAKAHEKLAGAQTRLTNQQVKTEEQVTLQYQLENALEQSFQDSTVYGMTGKELYTQYRLNELYGGVKCLTALNDQESWKKQAESIVKNYDNLVASYELATLYANGQISALSNAGQNTKDLLFFCAAAEECGYFDYVRTLAGAESAGKLQFGGSSTSIQAPGATESLEIIGKPKKRKR